jgi:hypothetical protein
MADSSIYGIVEKCEGKAVDDQEGIIFHNSKVYYLIDYIPLD